MQKFNRQSAYTHNINNINQKYQSFPKPSLTRALNNRQVVQSKKNYHLLQPFTTKMQENYENFEENISLSDIAPEENFECFNGKLGFYNDYLDVMDRSREQIDCIQQDCTELQLLHVMCTNMKKFKLQSPSKIFSIKNTQEIDVQKINSTISGILEKLTLLQSESLHIKIKLQEELIKNRQFSKQAEKELKDILIKVMKKVYVKTQQLNQTLFENQNLKRQISKLTEQLGHAKSKISNLQQKLTEEYYSQKAEHNKTHQSDQDENLIKVSQIYCIEKVKRSASKHLLVGHMQVYPLKKNNENSDNVKESLDSLNYKYQYDSNKTRYPDIPTASKEKQDVLSIERTDVQEYSRRGQLCNKNNNRLKRKQTIAVALNQSQKLIVNQQKRQRLKKFIAQRPSMPHQKTQNSTQNPTQRYSMNIKITDQEKKKTIHKQNPISQSTSSLMTYQVKEYVV